MATEVKNIVRRLEGLEKRLLPAPETEFLRLLRLRLEAGRQRVQAERERRGESEPVDLLPPEPADACKGMTPFQIIIYKLHRGRERNHLNWLAARKLRESDPRAAGDD
jgi:hypothetical protein